jgi:hypothetical protein
VRATEQARLAFLTRTPPLLPPALPFPSRRRWAFDVELLYLAVRCGAAIAEVPVTWHEVGGSTLEPLSAALTMFRDVCVLSLAYALGIWRASDGADRLDNARDADAECDDEAAAAAAAAAAQKGRAAAAEAGGADVGGGAAAEAEAAAAPKASQPRQRRVRGDE